jgi:hypothetical protein
MIAFGSMMAYGRTQIFQVSPGAASVASFLSISATRLSVHLAEHLCTPASVQAFNTLLKFPYGGDSVFVFTIDSEAFAKLFQLRIQVNRENVRDWNVVDMPHSALGRVFGRYIIL